MEVKRKLVCILWKKCFRGNQVKRRYYYRADYHLSDFRNHDGFVFNGQKLHEYYETDFY